MIDMHITGIDANLLVALDVLLVEQHVSRAARRMGITQSAMSRALGRLRELFDDDLLVRSGGGMRPTARALEVAGPLRRALTDLDAVLTSGAGFDPASTRRAFRVAAVDHTELVLLAPLSVRFEREAPGIDLAMVPLSRDPERDLETGQLDLIVAPRRPAGPAIVWTPLYDASYTCIVWDRHPARRLSPRAFAALQHALVSPLGGRDGIVDVALAEHGLARRVAVQVPSFFLLPDVLVGTHRIATVPKGIASTFCARFPLRVLSPPIPVRGFTMGMLWHEAYRHDPGHAWLRHEIATATAARARTWA